MGSFRAKPLALLFLMAVFPGKAFSKEAPFPAEPASAPDWGLERQRAEALLKTDLFDPQSAVFRWTSGFSWDYTKQTMIARRKWGWVACVSMNAKNRLGGYVGESDFIVQVDEDGKISTPYSGAIESKCGISSRMTPLQPVLLAQNSTNAQSPAEQLEKLAGLLDKGLITRAEFDTEKAKILGSN